MNQKENNVFNRFADTLNRVAEEGGINTEKIKKLDDIEKQLTHVSKQIDNHIPKKIVEVDRKVDKVIENHADMWSILCRLEENFTTLIQKLARMKIIR